MAAANTDKFIKAAPNWVGAVGSGGVADSVVTTVPLISTIGLPDDTAVEITVDRVDANGTATPTKKEVIKGVVSGNNLIDCIRGVEGTAQAHAAGAIVEIMLTADIWNEMIEAMIAGHNQDGTHDGETISVPTNAATELATVADDDLIPWVDSAAAFIFKKLKAITLKLYIMAGGTLTGELNLGENAGLVVDSALSADGKYSGITEAGTAGATLAFGDLCYLNNEDGRWELTDANVADGFDKRLGICVLAAAADGDATKMLLFGKVRADAKFPTMTVGAMQFMSETAGAIVSAQPTTSNACVRVVGHATTADELFFNPSPDYITRT